MTPDPAPEEDDSGSGAETGVPAAINCYRFSTGTWKGISGRYRPETAAGGD